MRVIDGISVGLLYPSLGTAQSPATINFQVSTVYYFAFRNPKFGASATSTKLVSLGAVMDDASPPGDMDDDDDIPSPPPDSPPDSSAGAATAAADTVGDNIATTDLRGAVDAARANRSRGTQAARAKRRQEPAERVRTVTATWESVGSSSKNP